MLKLSLITSFRRIRRSQGGFSAVEVLLAATVFGFLVTALIGAIVYGREATADAGDHARAVQLAEECIEATRNIGNDDYALLVNNTVGTPTYGLQNTTQWAFNGTSDTDPSGVYTRKVTIADAGTDRKTITCTINWAQRGGTTGTVTLNSRLTNWQAATTPPAPTTGPIMMAYSKTTATPSYRIWDGSAWGTEASAQNVTGNINYVVLKSARTRNEAILGVQTSTGAIYIQVWNGSAWGNLTQVGTGPTNTRSFDIAYEKNTDEAIIAFTPNATAVDFHYRTWDGATLSAATAVTMSPTTGIINWVEMKQNPLSASNEVSLILLDANSDVYGVRWDGASWSNMGVATVWDATAATATKKTIDVEYEQTSGEALFMWGDSVATDQYYRTWNGTTLSAATLLDIAAEGGLAEWVQLAARPGSNEIMLGVQDAGADLNTRKWSGSAWDTATQHPEHDATTENITSRGFDIVWETHSSNLGKAWILWGDGATITQRQWSGTTWGTAAIVSGTDDTSFIKLRADPVSGAVFSGIYQNSSAAANARDISERHLIGGSATWTAKNTMWAGPTSTEPVFFRVDIATP